MITRAQITVGILFSASLVLAGLLRFAICSVQTDSYDMGTKTRPDPAWTFKVTGQVGYPFQTGARGPKWSPDGEILAATTAEGHLGIWSKRDKKGSILVEDIRKFEWGGDGHWLAVTRYSGKNNARWSQLIKVDLVTRTQELVLEQPGKLFTYLERGPQGTTVASTDLFPNSPAIVLSQEGKEIPDPGFSYSWMISPKPSDSETWIEHPKKGRQRVSVDGHRFRLASSSPSGEVVAGNIAVEGVARTVIVDKEGKVVDVVWETGFLHSNWTADGRYIVGTVSIDDGDTILESNFAVYDFDFKSIRVFQADYLVREPVWERATGGIAFVTWDDGGLYYGTLNGGLPK